MILYYRKVRLLTVDYREVIDSEELLAWCDEEGRHLSYEGRCSGENFAKAEARILAVFGEDTAACNHIQVAQMPGHTRRNNINPHGLI